MVHGITIVRRHIERKPFVVMKTKRQRCSFFKSLTIPSPNSFVWVSAHLSFFCSFLFCQQVLLSQYLSRSEAHLTCSWWAVRCQVLKRQQMVQSTHYKHARGGLTGKIDLWISAVVLSAFPQQRSKANELQWFVQLRMRMRFFANALSYFPGGNSHII